MYCVNLMQYGAKYLCNGCINPGRISYSGLNLRLFTRNIRSNPKNSTLSFKSNRTKSRSDLPEKPFENLSQEGEEALRVSDLWKPLGFTLLFGSSCFVACSIWQYENVRSRTKRLFQYPSLWINERFPAPKRGSWRQEFNNYWNSLTEGQKTFVPICFLNVLVFLAWRVPRFQGTMLRYFCSNPASKTICLPMILSTFSHYSFVHLAINMYVLHSFSTGAVAALGKEQFVGFYLSAGVISSLASYMHKALTSQVGRSLGASGAIMGVLGYVCTQFPNTQLAIIFFPFYTFSASIAIKGIMAIDAAGIIAGWKFFDHAAHLGGALFGIAYCYWGGTYIWQRRQPLLKWWHELRTRNS